LKVYPEFYKNGSTCFLWQDLWADQVLEQAFPKLHSFAKNELISFRQACQIQELHDLFHLPLSVEAFQQFQELLDYLDSLQLMEEDDLWRAIFHLRRLMLTLLVEGRYIQLSLGFGKVAV